MSGEMHPSTNGWTLGTLKTYLDAQRDALAVHIAAEIAHARATAAAASSAAQVAIEKADTATAARFASVNEFRAALADQADRMMPRVESEARHAAMQEKLDALAAQGVARGEALTARLDELNRRMLLREGAETGTKDQKQTSLATIGMIVAAIGALSGVLGAVLATIMRPMGVH